MGEGPMILTQDREREEICMAEIRAVMTKHHCALSFVMNILPDGRAAGSFLAVAQPIPPKNLIVKPN